MIRSAIFTAIAVLTISTSAFAQQGKPTIDEKSIPVGWSIGKVNDADKGERCLPPRKLVLSPDYKVMPDGAHRHPFICK